jgi:hypothetical protein
LSEERQLNGYRVRLRVVEEYDVALLAESPDDAKARAEADLRRGDQFEDIQDSWPEEIVLVEAPAVEPYPELEYGAGRGTLKLARDLRLLQVRLTTSRMAATDRDDELLSVRQTLGGRLQEIVVWEGASASYPGISRSAQKLGRGSRSLML